MSRSRRFFLLFPLVFTAVPRAWAQKVELIAVAAKSISRSVDLPGEFQPFLSAALHARVPGYVERVLVDRGSVVKKGQLLAQIEPSIIKAQSEESRANLVNAKSNLQAALQSNPNITFHSDQMHCSKRNQGFSQWWSGTP